MITYSEKLRKGKGYRFFYKNIKLPERPKMFLSFSITALKCS